MAYVLKVLLLVLLAFGRSSCIYTGYKVYQVTPQTYENVEFLHNLADDKFDFWKESRIVGEASEIMAGPEDQLALETELTHMGLKYKVIVSNVERVLQEEKLARTLTRTFLSAGSVTFLQFMLLGEQMAYLRRLAEDYPQIASVETIGQSHEGRDILMLKISNGENPTTPKPAIFIDAGIHCREWITHPVALYAIQQLVENSTNAYMYENIDWYIVPNLNPDGYEYTITENRLWRKNRRLTPGAECYGTDLNRNFGYQWMVGGASNNSCSNTYAGPEEFSEPEASAVRDWFLESGENVKLYLSFHSFGEYLLYPWSYARLEPDDVELLHSLAVESVTAIEEASELGTSYYVNSSAVGLYVAAGVTTDWIKAEAGVQLSYIFELPNTDAPYSFMIPARNILPVVRETWEGIRVFYEHIEDNYVSRAPKLQEAPNWSNVLKDLAV